MTPEEYVRNMQQRSDDDDNKFFRMAAKAYGWGTCQYCGCPTDGGRNCCSDCWPLNDV